MDYANLVSGKADANAIEKKLVNFYDSTSNEICVVTVNSLNGETIDDVTYHTFKNWKIGDEKNDNGILLLIALKERKVRIEVGRGLEGAIPDGVAGSIIRNDIAPAFKQNNFLGGINTAIDHLQQAAAGEYKIAKDKKKTKTNLGNGIGLIIFIIIIIIVIISSINNRGGGYRRRNASDLLFPLLFNSGGWGNNNWGGGSSSDGDFGGFGGFGGGDTGGGGASGDW